MNRTVVSGHGCFHDPEGKHVGDICGAPYSTRKFAHARNCPLRGQPFIRLVLHEVGVEYVCHGCKRAWSVIANWGDKLDGEHRRTLRDDWCGWSLAEVMDATRRGLTLWVQQWGRGKSHLMQGSSIRCGRMRMDRPFPAKANAKPCRHCFREEVRK